MPEKVAGYGLLFARITSIDGLNYSHWATLPRDVLSRIKPFAALVFCSSTASVNHEHLPLFLPRHHRSGSEHRTTVPVVANSSSPTRVRGVGLAHVAELMGHVDTSMVSSHYAHLAGNVQHMREAAKKATGS